MRKGRSSRKSRAPRAVITGTPPSVEAVSGPAGAAQRVVIGLTAPPPSEPPTTTARADAEGARSDGAAQTALAPLAQPALPMDLVSPSEPPPPESEKRITTRAPDSGQSSTEPTASERLAAMRLGAEREPDALAGALHALEHLDQENLEQENLEQENLEQENLERGNLEREARADLEKVREVEDRPAIEPPSPSLEASDDETDEMPPPSNDDWDESTGPEILQLKQVIVRPAVVTEAPAAEEEPVDEDAADEEDDSDEGASDEDEDEDEDRDEASDEDGRAAADSDTDPDEVSVPPIGDLAVESFFSQGEVSRSLDENDEVSEKAKRKAAPHVVQRRAKLARYVTWAVGISAVVCLAALARTAVGRSRVAETPPRAAVAVLESPASKEAPTVVATEPPAQPAQPAETAAPPTPTPAEEAAKPAGDPKQEKEASRKALEAQKLQDAIDAGERAVALDPTDGEAWLILGVAYQMKGRMADAQRTYKKCVAEAKTRKGECAQFAR